MILDQGAGAHAAQVEYYGLGWMRTWVSGEAAVSVVVPRLTYNLDGPNLTYELIGPETGAYILQ